MPRLSHHDRAERWIERAVDDLVLEMQERYSYSQDILILAALELLFLLTAHTNRSTIEGLLLRTSIYPLSMDRCPTESFLGLYILLARSFTNNLWSVPMRNQVWLVVRCTPSGREVFVRCPDGVPESELPDEASYALRTGATLIRHSVAEQAELFPTNRRRAI